MPNLQFTTGKTHVVVIQVQTQITWLENVILRLEGVKLGLCDPCKPLPVFRPLLAGPATFYHKVQLAWSRTALPPPVTGGWGG